jgi:hypothetical protein
MKSVHGAVSPGAMERFTAVADEHQWRGGPSDDG